MEERTCAQCQPKSVKYVGYLLGKCTGWLSRHALQPPRPYAAPRREHWRFQPYQMVCLTVKMYSHPLLYASFVKHNKNLSYLNQWKSPWITCQVQRIANCHVVSSKHTQSYERYVAGTPLKSQEFPYAPVVYAMKIEVQSFEANWIAQPERACVWNSHPHNL